MFLRSHMNSQTLKAKENNHFLAINYNPKLGPFTDTWDDLVDEFGTKLHLEKYVDLSPKIKGNKIKSQKGW